MSRSTLLETANAAIQGYNTWTMESIMSCRAPNCIHQVLPLSLGRQPLNNEQYLAHFEPIMRALRKFQATVKNTVVDIEARQVVINASGTAMTDIGDYSNEYVLMLRMTRDGTKVEMFEESVDSLYNAEFFVKLRKRLVAKSEV